MSDAQSTSAFARRRRWARWRLMLAPALVALAVCLPKIWQGDFNVDTGWYAAIALQAYRGLDAAGLASWWTLQGAGASGVGAGTESIAYFNKPPVAFWLNGLPLAMFGPTIWAARIGSVVAVVLTVCATTLLVRRHAGYAAARAAGLVLATSIPFVSLGRSFSLDAWLTLFVVVALGTVLEERRRDHAWPVVYGGAALGLALLVKPLVALLGLLAVGIWLITRRDAARLARVAGVLALGTAIAAAWHAAMAFRFPDEFLAQYFGREIADRAAGDRAAATFNFGADSPLYYLRTLGESYWPWLVTLVLAALAMLGRKLPPRVASNARPGDRDWLWLGLIWTAVWLVSLSVFADKRPRYLAPLFPVWAWMSALWLTRAWGGGPAMRRVWRGIARGLPIGAVVTAIAISLLPVRVHKPQDANWAALLAWIDAHPDAAIHQGGFVGQRMAKIYLHTGRWPLLTADVAGRGRSQPPAGAYLLYHTRDGLTPGPNEEIVLQADKLLITRLTSQPWSPVPTPDPGE